MQLLTCNYRYGGAEHHQTKKVEDLMYGVNVWRLTGYLRLLHKCFESCPDQTNLVRITTYIPILACGIYETRNDIYIYSASSEPALYGLNLWC